MKTIKINLYSFSELSEKAQNVAIDEHREFLLSTMQISDFISGDDEHDTQEELQKCYDSEYKYLEDTDTPIIDSIESNDYLFYSSGELANCVTYTGKHPKAGITELKIGNDIYTI